MTTCRKRVEKLPRTIRSENSSPQQKKNQITQQNRTVERAIVRLTSDFEVADGQHHPRQHANESTKRSRLRTHDRTFGHDKESCHDQGARVQERRHRESGPSIASGSQHQLAAKTDLGPQARTRTQQTRKSRTLANDATDDEFDATGIDATDEQPDESDNDANPGTERAWLMARNRSTSKKSTSPIRFENSANAAELPEVGLST